MAAEARKPLRFLTAGSVDDGKSTLIGRLLVDSQAVLADQLAGLHTRAAGAPIDLALLTDGLEAEREQGITIDVAYRYFATPERKFIIADAPGHEQYTRNMVTAAAGSDAAVVLVDVTKLDIGERSSNGDATRDGAGTALVALLPQTRRHALLAQLLRVPHIVFAVNKIDAVADPAFAFARVQEALQAFCAASGIVPDGIVPISALRGDNVAGAAPIAGYDGPSLLALLEQLPDAHDDDAGPLLLPVQYIGADAAPGSPGHHSRVLWGRIARGQVVVGDRVAVFPSGEEACIAALYAADGSTGAVEAGRSAGIVLDRQLDVSRGDWLAAPGSLQPAARFKATLAWARHRARHRRPQVRAAPRQPLAARPHQRSHQPPRYRHPRAGARPAPWQ